MRVFVAGATGAIGRRLIYKLVQSGHAVAGMTRREEKAPLLRVLGADPILVDALDSDGVAKAIREFQPEVIVNELTAIPSRLNFRRFDEEFARTNRLRTEGTENLIAGARGAGVRKFISQSYAAWPYVREGSRVKTEEDPFDPNPPIALRSTMDALKYLESVTRGMQGIKGIVLRYGAFYGPGTSLSEGGSWWKICGGAGFLSLAKARGCGLLFTLTMRRRPPLRRSSEVRQGSTTLWMMIRRRSRSGSRSWPRMLARRNRCTCPHSSPGFLLATMGS